MVLELNRVQTPKAVGSGRVHYLGRKLPIECRHKQPPFEVEAEVDHRILLHLQQDYHPEYLIG
ncbi:hypothetical protein CsSME_00024208 [Camellia sinensis var. sinensis]